MAALLEARSVRDAARTANVAERTAWRYLADDQVRAELANRLDAMLAQVTAGLIEDLSQARQVLRDVMARPGIAPGVRVRAAGMVLNYGLRFVELVALAERVAALEEAIRGR